MKGEIASNLSTTIIAINLSHPHATAILETYSQLSVQPISVLLLPKYEVSLCR